MDPGYYDDYPYGICNRFYIFPISLLFSIGFSLLIIARCVCVCVRRCLLQIAFIDNLETKKIENEMNFRSNGYRFYFSIVFFFAKNICTVQSTNKRFWLIRTLPWAIKYRRGQSNKCPTNEIFILSNWNHTVRDLRAFEQCYSFDWPAQIY